MPGVHAVQPGWVSRSFCVPLCPCLSQAPSREPRPRVLVCCGPCCLRGGHTARVVASAAQLPHLQVRERMGTKVQIPPLLLRGCVVWGGGSTSLCCVLLRMYTVGVQQ